MVVSAAVERSKGIIVASHGIGDMFAARASQSAIRERAFLPTCDVTSRNLFKKHLNPMLRAQRGGHEYEYLDCPQW